MAVSFQSAASVSRRYLVDVAFDDKKTNSGFLAEYDAPLLSFCSALCGVTCICFGLNLKERKCQVHNSVKQTNITAQEAGWKHYFSEALPKDKNSGTFPMDCRDIYVNGQTRSGVYQIYPFENDKSLVVNVSCNMENCGRYWTVIQKRRSGSVSFNRFWAEYKKGFGNLEDSYWIGNDVIHKLTKGRKSSLYVSITLQDGRMLYEYYDQFSVSDEADNFRLFLGGPAVGTLGDSMTYHSGMAFSTRDRERDRYRFNCAGNNKGGWWFKSCHKTFLNGPWSPGSWSGPWRPTLEGGNEITEILMMIKPH